MLARTLCRLGANQITDISALAEALKTNQSLQWLESVRTSTMPALWMVLRQLAR